MDFLGAMVFEPDILEPNLGNLSIVCGWILVGPQNTLEFVFCLNDLFESPQHTLVRCRSSSTSRLCLFLLPWQQCC